MDPRFRLLKVRIKQRLERKWKATKAKIYAIKSIEINGPLNVSLHFNMKHSCEFSTICTLLETSGYFKNVNELFEKWEAEKRWKVKGRQKRKAYLIRLIANILLLPMMWSSKNGQFFKRPFSKPSFSQIL
ncbi:MAG: hypothetical protein WBB23_03305 [Desulforhopalus sp.]